MNLYFKITVRHTSAGARQPGKASWTINCLKTRRAFVMDIRVCAVSRAKHRRVILAAGAIKKEERKSGKLRGGIAKWKMPRRLTKPRSERIANCHNANEETSKTPSEKDPEGRETRVGSL